MAFFDLEDNRYKGTREPLAWAVAGLVVVTIILIILTWREVLIRREETKLAMLDKDRTARPTVLSPEEALARQITQLRVDVQGAMLERRWLRVAKLAQRILDITPEDGDAWSKLGLAQARTEDYGHALTALTKAIELDFQPSLNLYQRACVRRKMGDLPAALRDLDEAAQRDPSSVVISNLRMIFQIQAGKASEVRTRIAAYEKAGGDTQAEYFLGAAALALQEGRITKAVQFLTAFRQLVPREDFAQLLEDAFFDPYRKRTELLPFFANL